jgi:hypothetical protein
MFLYYGALRRVISWRSNNVSEESDGSIFRVEENGSKCFRVLVPINQITRRHKPEESNPHGHRRRYLMSQPGSLALHDSELQPWQAPVCEPYILPAEILKVRQDLRFSHQWLCSVRTVRLRGSPTFRWTISLPFSGIKN